MGATVSPGPPSAHPQAHIVPGPRFPMEWQTPPPPAAAPERRLPTPPISQGPLDLGSARDLNRTPPPGNAHLRLSGSESDSSEIGGDLFSEDSPADPFRKGVAADDSRDIRRSPGLPSRRPSLNDFAYQKEEQPPTPPQPGGQQSFSPLRSPKPGEPR